ncbi:MAG: hypothetical protein OXL68_11085 [Paracoccaceae bacterium]|nr:hypothetical protein [Paracoccaceae bacterium]
MREPTRQGIAEALTGLAAVLLLALRFIASPPLLISEPGPAWIMPVAGTFMRGRHALKPAGTTRRRRETEL